MRLEKEEDIKRLIEEGIPESYHFEYKQQRWAKTRKGNIELAKDLSALANTEGGVIIIGIAENKKTHKLEPHPIKFEDIKDRITGVLENNVREPIRGYIIKLIPLPSDSTKGYVIIEVPDSPNKPHMVTVKGEHRYYKRVNAVSNPMTNAEVEYLFAMKYEQEKRLEEFYAPLFKVAKIVEEEIREDNTQWFFYFMPVPYQGNRLNLYQKEFNQQIKDAVKESGFSGFTNRPLPPHFDCLGFTDSKGLNYGFEKGDKSIWIHPNGGVLAISSRMIPGILPPIPFIQGQFIPIDRLIWFLESSSKFVKSLFPATQNIQTNLVLKNVVGWQMINFISRYNENFEDWLNSVYKGSVPPIPRITNQNKDTDILIEHRATVQEFAEENLRSYLKENIVKRIYRKFGYPIPDE